MIHTGHQVTEAVWSIIIPQDGTYCCLLQQHRQIALVSREELEEKKLSALTGHHWADYVFDCGPMQLYMLTMTGQDFCATFSFWKLRHAPRSDTKTSFFIT